MNTRIIGLVSALVLVGMVSTAQNLTVNYSGGSGAPIIVGPDGTTPLADGNDVEIGWFDSSFNVAANAGDLAALATARQSGVWHTFGSTTITHNFLLPAGSFAGSSSQSAAFGFTGHQIDLWIFQTPGAAAPDAALDNVSAWGLFSSTVNTSPSQTWTFPAAGIGAVDNITTADVSPVSGILYHGQLTPSPDNSLEVTGVPEPSTAALFGLGLASLGVFARRIQRKSD